MEGRGSRIDGEALLGLENRDGDAGVHEERGGAQPRRSGPGYEHAVLVGHRPARLPALTREDSCIQSAEISAHRRCGGAPEGWSSRALRLRAAPGAPAPSLAQRRAPRADDQLQPGALGPGEGDRPPLLRRGAARAPGSPPRPRGGLPQLLVARVRPASGDLADDSRHGRGRRSRRLHHERQDRARAPRDHRRRARTRLGVDRPQLRAGRPAHQLRRQPRRRAHAGTRDAPRLRGGHGATGEGLAIVVPSGHAGDAGYPRERGADFFSATI